jgi:hypothetical protein
VAPESMKCLSRLGRRIFPNLKSSCLHDLERRRVGETKLGGCEASLLLVLSEGYTRSPDIPIVAENAIFTARPVEPGSHPNCSSGLHEGVSKKDGNRSIDWKIAYRPAEESFSPARRGRNSRIAQFPSLSRRPVEDLLAASSSSHSAVCCTTAFHHPNCFELCVPESR